MEEDKIELEENEFDESWFDLNKINLDDAIKKFKDHVNRMKDDPKFSIKGIDCRDMWVKLDEMYSLHIHKEPNIKADSLWVARVHPYNLDTQTNETIISPFHNKVIAHYWKEIFFNHITSEEVN
jgi:hypothetical protein